MSIRLRQFAHLASAQQVVERIQKGIRGSWQEQSLDGIKGGDSTLDDTEYALDAAAPGLNKGQTIRGHAISEEPGMEDCTNWRRIFITEVPIQFIRAGERFRSPKASRP